MFLRDSNPETSISIGTNFKYGVFKIIYSQQDDRILAGESCSLEGESGHVDCIGKALEHIFLSSYGCLPPWWPIEDNKTCEQDLPIKTLTDKKFKKIWYEIDYLTDSLKIGPLKKCLRPCLAMSVKVSELSTVSNYPYENKLKLYIEGQVKVTKPLTFSPPST